MDLTGTRPSIGAGVFTQYEDDWSMYNQINSNMATNIDTISDILWLRHSLTRMNFMPLHMVVGSCILKRM